jgi:hypothetical protein
VKSKKEPNQNHFAAEGAESAEKTRTFAADFAENADKAKLATNQREYEQI